MHGKLDRAFKDDVLKLKAATKVPESETGNIYQIPSIVRNKPNLEYFYKCRDDNISTQCSFFPVDDVLTFNRPGAKQLFSIVTRRNT
jgi:hypothetical protein